MLRAILSRKRCGSLASSPASVQLFHGSIKRKGYLERSSSSYYQTGVYSPIDTYSLFDYMSLKEHADLFRVKLFKVRDFMKEDCLLLQILPLVAIIKNRKINTELFTMS